jgi:hypothetical protein
MTAVIHPKPISSLSNGFEVESSSMAFNYANFNFPSDNTRAYKSIKATLHCI